MSEKLGQEPAFPLKSEGIANRQKGMSKRFYAACAAMQGILSNEELRTKILSDQRNGHKDLIGISYEYADELLKKENE